MAYENGSNLLLKVGEKCVGHCTTHKIQYNSTTKEHAVKPVATAKAESGLFSGKTVTGLGITITFEGLRFYEETENGPMEIASQWGKGQSVPVEAFKRGEDTAPYVKGDFVIDSLDETYPAKDDVTYSGSLSNDGEPEIYPGKEPAAAE